MASSRERFERLGTALVPPPAKIVVQRIAITVITSAIAPSTPRIVRRPFRRSSVSCRSRASSVAEVWRARVDVVRTGVTRWVAVTEGAPICVVAVVSGSTAVALLTS